MSIEEIVERLHARALNEYSAEELAADARSMDEDYWVSAYNLIQEAIDRRVLTADEADVVGRAARDGRFGRKMSGYMTRWLVEYVPSAA